MVDFEQSRKEALDYLNLTESAQKLSNEKIHRLKVIEKTELKLARYVEVWILTTELFFKDRFEGVDLYFGLPSEFPLVLPKVYLSYSDRKRLKYLPHVDNDGQVCIFDDEEVHVNWEHPGQIVKECLNKTRNVLEQGLNGKNVSDFEEEFSAYWEQKYSKLDKVRAELSMLAENILPPIGPLSTLSVSPEYKGYSLIIHTESDEYGRVRLYLSDMRRRLTDGSALFLGLAGNTLPFDETYSSAYNFIRSAFPGFEADFRNYISKEKGPLIVVFARSVMGRYVFYGWQIGPLTTERKGFRKKSLTPWFVFTNLDSKRPVVRLKFETFTSKRLSLRTDGTENWAQAKKISIVGLGSIGSNLLPYLTALPLRQLDLIDPDVLTIENINRHLLGMNYIKRHKVDAIAEYLRSANPMLDVRPHPTSIIPFLRNHSKVLIESDLVVVCIGKTNIEEYVLSMLMESDARNAVAVIWVEPYLAGAHCLYLRPNSHIDFGGLFDDGIFRFNIIDSSEYKNPQKSMLLKEGGCQTSYLPYGRQSIKRFLAALIPHLYDLIENPSESNYLLSFKGDDTVIRNSGLMLSQVGTELSINTIGKIQLNDNSNR